MIVEYLRYTIPTDRQAGFIEAYRNAGEPLRQSPFCQAFEICQCVEDPGQFVVRIEWTSAEDHLEKFRKSEEFRRFFVFVRPYVGNIDEMRHYRTV